MKTLKLMLAGIALLFASVAANAAVKPNHDQPSQADVVNMYINAIANGKTTDLDKILNGDLTFNINRGDNVTTLNKSEVINYLKSNASVIAPVETKTTVMTDDETLSKVKIEFKYEGFVRTDIVTLSKSFGWRVVNVDTSSK